MSESPLTILCVQENSHRHNGGSHSHRVPAFPHALSDCGGGEGEFDFSLCSDTCKWNYCFNWAWETDSASSGQSDYSTATINSAAAGLGGVVADGDEAAKVGGETRPKNMKAVFIMRIE